MLGGHKGDMSNWLEPNWDSNFEPHLSDEPPFNLFSPSFIRAHFESRAKNFFSWPEFKLHLVTRVRTQWEETTEIALKQQGAKDALCVKMGKMGIKPYVKITNGGLMGEK
ncbi:hypothetical protein PoB_006612200 [Plakobranchus ocellatus]|uniref:Uncharacterized protein n=1 Tax=Plakobranchus ocellatus TaxID=259542 RepID=A0AAV4D5Y6_9GAST|nr:hypothetical protein PoB_006612200 [Plakobranchus ocellatus]